MSIVVNRVKNVVVGEYGNPVLLQLVDEDNVLIDISSYNSTKTVSARGPKNSNTALSFSASFVTDGTDGKVQFTPSSTNYFTAAGVWEAQVKLTKTNTQAMTVVFEIEVEKAIG